MSGTAVAAPAAAPAPVLPEHVINYCSQVGTVALYAATAREIRFSPKQAVNFVETRNGITAPKSMIRHFVNYFYFQMPVMSDGMAQAVSSDITNQCISKYLHPDWKPLK